MGRVGPGDVPGRRVVEPGVVVRPAGRGGLPGRVPGGRRPGKLSSPVRRLISILAVTVATGALCAAKIVWRQAFEDERPFQREFEGLQKYERISRAHPSQLALFHIGRNDGEGYFYYVMELADDLGERSNGVLKYCGTPAFQYSCTPLFHSS